MLTSLSRPVRTVLVTAVALTLGAPLSGSPVRAAVPEPGRFDRAAVPEPGRFDRAAVPEPGRFDRAAVPAAGPLDRAGLSAADQARMHRQRPLVAAATQLRWEIERHRHPGYAGITLADGHVALWWKGPVPAAMATVVARASGIAPIRLRPAAHTLAELRAAAARIRSGRGGTAVHSIKLGPDGSGLVAGVRPDGRTPAVTALADAGVPVRVVAEEPLRPVSRDDDQAPWKGGATIVNTNQSTACTAGFGVRSGGTSYLLTAAHCGQSGHRIQDARGEFIGTVGPRHQDHDVALVPTTGVDGLVYVGGPADNAMTAVEGWGWTFVGEYLCQSGVTSSRQVGGPVCNLKVLFFYADREDLVEAEQTNGQTAARPGDSGGPVYAVSGSGRLIAKGTTTRVAGARLGFQDFGTAWRDFGVTPATR